MAYFIINNSDGETYVEELSKEEVVKRLKVEDGDDACYYGHVEFIEKILTNDTNYWGDNILIIKG